MAIPKLKKACIDYVPDLINADHGKLLVQVSRWYDDEDNAVSSRTRAGRSRGWRLNVDHGKLLVQVSTCYDDEHENAVSSRTRAFSLIKNKSWKNCPGC